MADSDDELIRALKDAGRRAKQNGEPPPTCAGNDNVSEARTSIMRRGWDQAQEESKRGK